MAMRKVLFIVVVFFFGFIMAGVFFSPESWAQYVSGAGAASGYDEVAMTSKVPSSYGNLVAISGIYLYFQGDDGTIYILKQRTQSELDSRVVVIKRSE